MLAVTTKKKRIWGGEGEAKLVADNQVLMDAKKKSAVQQQLRPAVLKGVSMVLLFRPSLQKKKKTIFEKKFKWVSFER